MATMQKCSIAELAVKQLEGSRGALLAFLETFSDSELTAKAGGKGNHALWIMGHLALADDFFVSSFLQEESCLPESHGVLFSPGTVPLDDASAYPSREELLARLATARTRTLDWVKTLEGDAAWAASPEELAKFAPDAISAAFTLCKHEFMHAGQLTSIRASLGMQPRFL